MSILGLWGVMEASTVWVVYNAYYLSYSDIINKGHYKYTYLMVDIWQKV